MARIAAQAVAGFVPTTTELLPSIGALVRCGEGDHVFVDPCAGEGEAVFALAEQMVPPGEREHQGKTHPVQRARVYACEMEATRFAALRARAAHRHEVAHGDAFRLKLGSEAAVASVMLLNPPFSPDRDAGRLEEKWLRRFGPVLRAGGALLFVLPFYALAASAVTLATAFCELACFRFRPWPDEYKRVVLVARRRSAPLLASDPELVERVCAWSANPDAIPELPEAGPALFEVAGSNDRMPHGAWRVQPLDERGLREAHVPWHQTDRGGRLLPLPNVVPAERFGDLLSPRFPVATVPRPAHLAAGLASGVLSGARLRPTDPASGLPEILVRGTFARRFVTIEEKLNKHHEKVGEIQAQVPELQIVALDLRAGTFHTLGASVDATGARRVADMTAGDLLASYGRDLLATLRDRCPALYDPTRPEDVFELPAMDGARPLFSAQADAVRACMRLLGEGDRTAVLLGEIGTGKTTVSVRAALAAGARRVFVVVPPHVAPGFAKQVPTIWPAARAVHLETIADVDAFMADPDERPIVAVLTRSDAKLGHAWAGVEGGRCPRCGAGVGSEPDELAKRRLVCGGRRWEATGPAGFLVARLAEVLHVAAAGSVNARAFVPGRIAVRLRERALSDQGRQVAAWSRALGQLATFVPEVLALVGSHPTARTALAWLLWAIGDHELTAATARVLYVGSCFDPRSHGAGSDLRMLARTLLLTAGDPGATVASEVRAWGLDRPSYYGATDPWLTHAGEAAKLARGEKAWADGFTIEKGMWHLDVIPRLARMLGEVGKVAVLDAGKVSPGKRDAWIAAQIAKKVRILVLNPVCVATGINSMVPYFSTDVWYENPACNPQVLRQAKGRTRRIGQEVEKRSYFLVYEGTAQAVAYKLLLHKAGIGEAADGLDATAALQAAGVGTADALVARDLGRALFEELTRGEDGAQLAA